MSKIPARFVWYDLMTTDTEAAAKFYQEVIGWRSSPANIPDSPPYTLLSMGEAPLCGIMGMPETSAGARPVWIGHIGVADLEASIESVKDAGGSIHRPPAVIPGIGRFAVAADPHGTAFVLFQSLMPMPAGDGSPVLAPGHVGWHELHAGELEADYDFYAGLFGWTSAGDIDMGPSGAYRMFATGGSPAGGMMQKMPQAPAPFWQFYFIVEGVQAAIDRATAAGAKLMMGPQEVPGGSWIAQLFDPQGAVFAITARDR